MLNRFVLLIGCLSVFFLPFTVLGGESLPDLFERVNPAVVDIKAISVDKVTISENQTTSISVGNDGSGVLIDDQGTILTASHVIQTAEEVTIKFLDGQEVPASIIASANWGDIALLKIDQQINLPEPVILADSDKVRIGDNVFVVGAPFGFSHSLSAGYISSRFMTGAMLGSGTMEVFQTDAAMNPGNSGGPLFNMEGEVIGIASHIRTTSGGFNGLAFAVTTNQIRQLLEKVSSWSGIEGAVISGKKAELFNLPQKAGLLVQKVAANSWGGKVGLHPSTIQAVIDGEAMTIGGDIILQIGSMVVNTDPSFFQDMTDYLFTEAQAGKETTMLVLRGGQIIPLPPP
jgi:serine protease Do